MSILLSKSDYPIYAVDMMQSNTTNAANEKSYLSVGGGRDGGFLGVPMYVYSISPHFKQET